MKPTIFHSGAQLSMFSFGGLGYDTSFPKLSFSKKGTHKKGHRTDIGDRISVQ
jgi:hypothetical protein